MEVLSFHLCLDSVTQKRYPLFPVHLHPVACCYPSCQVDEVFWCRSSVSRGFTILEKTNAFSGMIVDMMLGLLISLQSFTMNRHHAEREMTEALHESKLNGS